MKLSELSSCKTRTITFCAFGITRCWQIWTASKRRSPSSWATSPPPKPSPIEGEGFEELKMALTSSQALWFELMQFYIREAWLLDERKLKEWLDLFTDDVLYFMPRR